VKEGMSTKDKIAVANGADLYSIKKSQVNVIISKEPLKNETESPFPKQPVLTKVANPLKSENYVSDSR
jgi:hypothetical protein